MSTTEAKIGTMTVGMNVTIPTTSSGTWTGELVGIRETGPAADPDEIFVTIRHGEDATELRTNRKYTGYVNAYTGTGATYYPSQWTGALADLKDAAHEGGVPFEQTDQWAVRHDVGGVVGRSVLGAFTADGVFWHIAQVTSPDALRDLRHLYPTDGGE